MQNTSNDLNIPCAICSTTTVKDLTMLKSHEHENNNLLDDTLNPQTTSRCEQFRDRLHTLRTALNCDIHLDFHCKRAKKTNC